MKIVNNFYTLARINNQPIYFLDSERHRTEDIHHALRCNNKKCAELIREELEIKIGCKSDLVILHVAETYEI